MYINHISSTGLFKNVNQLPGTLTGRQPSNLTNQIEHTNITHRENFRLAISLFIN